MLNLTSAQALRLGLFCLASAAVVVPAPAANVFVPAGGDLQGALNQARGGDTITLAAGAVFTGNFTLAPNNVRQWITVQSSAMSSLPAFGSRVSPAQAAYMPKLVSRNAGAALTVPDGANYYQIQGVEVTVAPGVYVNDLIDAGTMNETGVGQLPHHLVFDRDYIHGDPDSGGKRGVALNSATTVIKNSYFKDFTSDWQDTQAICGWNGSGPFTIQNNHLEAGGEILAFGGAVPSIPGLIPSHIIVENNEFYKPMDWWWGSPNYIGRNVRAKNHLELKNAQDVLIENNTFTNNFVGADQMGFILLLNVRDEGGRVPWATVSNIRVTHNLFQHTAGGALLMGHDQDLGGTAANISFSNNIWLDVNGYGGQGSLYQIMSAVHNLTIDHETAFPTGYLLVFAHEPSSGIRVTNNIFTAGWGIAGDGGSHNDAALAVFAPDTTVARNAIIGGWPGGFTGAHFENNVLPASIAAAGFVDYAGSDVRLTTDSLFRRQAADGLDLGSNLAPAGQAVAANAANSAGSPAGAAAPNGWVNLVSKSSSQCIDVEGISTQAGANLHAWTCLGADNQKFQFGPAYAGYQVTAKNSRLQWDVAGGKGAVHPGDHLIQYPYWGGPNEIFSLAASGDGYMTIHPLLSGLCLGWADNSRANGVALVQQTCTGADNQLWKFVPAP